MRTALFSLLLWSLSALVVPARSQDVLRIAAVVNEDIVSVFDLVSRLRLVIVSARLPNTSEVRNRLAKQILRSLIDEKLQLQEAKRLSLTVTSSEIKAGIAALEKRNNIPAGTFGQFLARSGMNSQTVVDQIGAAMAWKKIVRQRITPLLKISDEEVEEAMAAIKASRDQPQHLLSEIFFSVDTPDQENSVRETAERILTQIRKGADFAAVARQFSQSTTASGGGDLGWMQKGQFDKAIDAVLPQMKPGQVLGPIRTLTGYVLLMLRDRRLPTAAKPEDAVVTLAQVKLEFPSDAGPDDIASQKDLARTISETANGCADLTKIGRELGASAAGILKDAKVRDITPALRSLALSLKVGAPSQPLDFKNSVVVIIVCARSDATGLPSKKEVYNVLARRRLGVMTRRYLRDLRRSAFLDIRL